MSAIYMPQNVSRKELAEAVLKHLRDQADTFERDWVRRNEEDVGFSGTLTAAAKLGVTCIPKAPVFELDAGSCTTESNSPLRPTHHPEKTE